MFPVVAALAIFFMKSLNRFSSPKQLVGDPSIIVLPVQNIRLVTNGELSKKNIIADINPKKTKVLDRWVEPFRPFDIT